MRSDVSRINRQNGRLRSAYRDTAIHAAEAFCSPSTMRRPGVHFAPMQVRYEFYARNCKLMVSMVAGMLLMIAKYVDVCAMRLD